jgi:hypothetical protein
LNDLIPQGPELVLEMGKGVEYVESGEYPQDV